MTVSVALILIVAITYQTIFGGIPTAEAATGYPDTLVGYMQYLAKQDYMFLDVSNMRLQQEGIGPSWNKTTTLYYRNITKGTNWQSSKSSVSEGLSDEEKKMVRELRQSNIYCWKITDEDTDLLEFSYSNDKSVNCDHYYRTASYKAGDVKGNLYAYLASYTAKAGDNEGKKAYMIGKVSLPKVETQEEEEASEEESVEEEEIDSSDKEETENVENTKSEENTKTNEKENSDTENVTPTETEEEIEVTEAEIMADEDIVTIRIKHDFSTSGAYIVFYKDGAYAGDAYKKEIAINETIQFDCSSTAYNGFNIEEKVGSTSTTVTGNKTKICTTADIQAAVAQYNSGNKLIAEVGGWSGQDILRTITLKEFTSLSDSSLNIPEGTFEKSDNTLYVKSTFYDYYSDDELNGTSRKNYTGTFTDADKVQAGKFNDAIAEYFRGTSLATSTGQSPLYFGDFYSYADRSVYLNFIKNNNNGEFIRYNGNPTARQGLVNDTLVNGELVMGTDNVVVPYFNEAFLRGGNCYSDNIGYVFKNVEFPFLLNSKGYWEFNSYDSTQSLRMKKDGDNYFLDRTGVGVHGHTSTATTANSNFFPFNDVGQSGNVRALNYAFGAKLEIPFYMTSDGMVTMSDGTKKEITFEFLGDDDIWIFIDDDLILDIGGDHGAVEGMINFAQHTATTTISTGPTTKTFTALDPSERHVLTLYYMERGIWESNMKITFNFPQSNKLEVEKEIEVPEGVNSIFQKAIDEVLLKQISFPISISNMATSGNPLGVSEQEKEVDLTFDSIDSNTKASLRTTPSGSSLVTNTSGGSRTEVMKYTWPTQKKDTEGQTVTDNRSAVLNYQESGTVTTLDINTDQIKSGGYLEFDAYLDYNTSGGPFIALIDEDGDRIGGWAEGMVYTGGTGTMKAKTWTTIKVSISKMAQSAVDLTTQINGTTANGTFDYDKVAQLQFAHWAPATVYIDNISIKAPATYSSTGGFSKDQSKIPDYGSIGTTVDDYKLMPINGAEYVLNPVASDDGNTYSYVNNGSIYLKHTDLAMFTDQFRRESYLSINEGCNQDNFETTWEIFEDEVLQKSGTGTAVEDGREEESPGNDGVTKPSGNTMLFKSYDNEFGEDTTHFYNLRVKYTNKLKLGSIKIKKNVVDGQGNLVDNQLEYKIRVTFSDIAGLGLEGTNYGAYTAEDTICAEQSLVIDANKYFEITGIPAGTVYTIEEVQEDRDDFILTDIKHETGNDTSGSYDKTNKLYSGTIMADTESDATDVITIVNNINPVTEDGDLGGKKIWSGDVTPDPAPEGVKLKLQRRFAKKEATDGTAGTDADKEYEFADVRYEDGKTVEFEVKDYESQNVTDPKACEDGNKIIIKTGSNFSYNITGLPLYGLNANGRQRKYEYRFVETAILTKDSQGNDKEIEINISNDSTGNETVENAVIDTTTGYKVTGGIAVEGNDKTTYNVTNTYAPETSLQITKVSGDDHQTGLKGVTLWLQKMVKKDDGSLEIDQSFNGDKGYREATTEDGGMLTFLDLPDGTYRLLEVKTVEGYSLMASPINIVISRLHGSTANDGNNEYSLETEDNTVKITISNQGLLELPMTGSRGRWYVITLGIILIAGGEGLYLWNMYSHRRKRHSQRRK